MKKDRRVPCAGCMREGTNSFRPGRQARREPFFRGFGVRSWRWSTIFIKTGIPILLREGLSQQKLSRCPVEDVKESVSVGPKHHFPRFTLPLDIGEDRHLHGIVITFVMRHELVIPFQFPRIRIQCEHGIGIEIISRTRVPVPSGIWIPGSPKRKVGFRIIGTRDPDGRPPYL